MDLGDAAALCVCARGEKERLEGQHECIWLVASGRWCLAMRRSQQERQRQQACARKERERADLSTKSDAELSDKQKQLDILR